MADMREQLKDLVDKAKEIHSSEKKRLLESYRVIGLLELKNAAVNLQMTKEEFACACGLTVDVYWKRAQAGRIIIYFPKVEQMLRAGELQFSHVGYCRRPLARTVPSGQRPNSSEHGHKQDFSYSGSNI